MTQILTTLADPEKLITFDGEAFALLPLAALATAMNAGGLFFSYDFSINLNASLLTGRQTATVTITGLLTTDRLVEVQPIADLPGSLSVVYAFISAANTLKVAFSTSVIYTGNTNISMRLTVLRAN